MFMVKSQIHSVAKNEGFTKIGEKIVITNQENMEKQIWT